MKLEILEKIKAGRGFSGDGPFVSITSNGAYINRELVEFLKIKEDDKGVFAKNEQTGIRSEEIYDWFFAIIPITSNIKGYHIYFDKNKYGARIGSKTFIYRGMPEGRYVLQDPVYNKDTGFDWFPMTKINEL